MNDFTIITEDMLSNMYIDINDFLNDKIIDHLKMLRIDYQMLLEESLVDCESPIEQLLSLYLNDLIYSFNHWNPFIDMSFPSPNQEIICANGKTYRLDFYIVVAYKNQETKYFGIECDGYEFHQKTKEQVEYDNQRQRDLQAEGIEIIRFSGSEIWNNPIKCVNEIKNIILSKCQYIQEKTNGN